MNQQEAKITPLYTHPYLDLFWLMCLCVLFYFMWLGSYPAFIPDEGRYAEIAREMLASGDYITPRIDGVPFLDKPIFHYWLQTLAMKVFGLNEWSIRFFPVLFALLGILATYITARSIYNRRTAILSTVILATSPLYFICSHYADLNMEVAVLISLSLFAFILAKKHKNHQQSIYVFMYICAGLAFLTKGLIGIVFVGGIGFVWMTITKQWQTVKNMRLLTGALIVLAINLPWFYLVQQANPTFLYYFFIDQQFYRFVSTTFNNPQQIWFYIPVIMLGTFPWIIFLMDSFLDRLKLYYREPQKHPYECFFLIWFIAIFLFFSIPKSKIIGYILPIFPALAIIIGHHINEIWHTDGKRLTKYFVYATLILICLFAVFPYFDWLNYNSGFKINLWLIVIINILVASLAWYFPNRINIPKLVWLCGLSMSLSILVVFSGVKYLQDTSTKDMTLKLRSQFAPQDKIVIYHDFFQDVPLYLERKVYVVARWLSPNIAKRDNWARELWLGKNLDQKQQYMIDEAFFWQMWQSSLRVFVILDKRSLKHFNATANNQYKIITRNKFNILIVNH